MKYPREYLALAERIIREYPERRRECKLVVEAVEAMCHGHAQMDAREMNPGSSEPERVAEALEANKDYQRLVKGCAVVERAIAKLAKEERAVVELAFWDNYSNREIAEELHMEERTVQRFKNKASKKISRYFLCPAIAGFMDINLSYPRQG
jgi:RNA polymerase sigma factor (sigma-70 family)